MDRDGAGVIIDVAAEVVAAAAAAAHPTYSDISCWCRRQEGASMGGEERRQRDKKRHTGNKSGQSLSYIVATDRSYVSATVATLALYRLHRLTPSNSNPFGA